MLYSKSDVLKITAASTEISGLRTLDCIKLRRFKVIVFYLSINVFSDSIKTINVHSITPYTSPSGNPNSIKCTLVRIKVIRRPKTLSAKAIAVENHNF